jgi:hypothetical protein
MKTKLWLIISIALISLLVISACASTSTPTPAEVPVIEEPVVEYPIIEEPAVEIPEEILGPLTDAEMEAFILEKADGNHALEFILKNNFTREEWSAVLDRMIGYGAKISPEEKEIIIEWLVNR